MDNVPMCFSRSHLKEGVLGSQKGGVFPGAVLLTRTVSLA